MDDQHFASLCRAMADATTRRGAVGTLAGLLGLGLMEASAKGGAFGGKLGGRRGKNRRGRKRRNRQQNDRRTGRSLRGGLPKRDDKACRREWAGYWADLPAWDVARCGKFRECPHYDDYRGKDLSFCNLCNRDLHGVDLTGANLTHANLAGAILVNANLTRVIWTNADLFRTTLACAKISGNFDQAHFCDTTKPDVNNSGDKFDKFITRDCKKPIATPICTPTGCTLP